MSEMQDFQNRGEPYRRKFGIDGTAGDAQDIPHPFVWPYEEEPDRPPCLACGLAKTARVHQQETR